MATDSELAQLVQADARALLDSQIENLSQRLLEVGRRADQQLTIWLTFVALTLVVSLGVVEEISLGGVKFKSNVTAAITYLLSCVFYYRANLSMAVLSIWRKLLRERRSQRFALLLNLAEKSGPKVLADTRRDLEGYVSEFPGYLASIVLLKAEARKHGGMLERYVRLIHYASVAAFVLSPYALAVALVMQASYASAVIAVAVIGLVVTVSGNALARVQDNA